MYNTHNCEVQILWNYMTEEEAFKAERVLIAYYRQYTNCRLANICDGGEGASGHRWTEEEKTQIRLRSLGDKNPNYGNHWTDEQKQALRESSKPLEDIKGKLKDIKQ